MGCFEHKIGLDFSVKCLANVRQQNILEVKDVSDRLQIEQLSTMFAHTLLKRGDCSPFVEGCQSFQPLEREYINLFACLSRRLNFGHR